MSLLFLHSLSTDYPKKFLAGKAPPCRACDTFFSSDCGYAGRRFAVSEISTLSMLSIAGHCACWPPGLRWAFSPFGQGFFLGLAQSIVSFTLYSVWPIAPIYTLTNPDGRENSLYYFTFTKSALPFAIRPSFIFDELGTFFFVVCMGAVLRDLLGKSKAITGLMLLSGLITFSLAHLAVLLVLIFVNRGERKIKLAIIQSLTVGCFAVYLLPVTCSY